MTNLEDVDYSAQLLDLSLKKLMVLGGVVI